MTMRELIQMVKDADEQLHIMEQLTTKMVNDIGYSFDIVYDLHKFSKDQINEFTPEVLMSIYRKFTLKSSDIPLSYDEKVSAIKTDLLQLWDSADAYFNMINAKNDIDKELQNAMSDYNAYISSDEMKKREENQLKDLREKVELEKDQVKKAAYKKKLDIIESSRTFDFMYERMESLQSKEIDNIVASFFDKRRSNYIIDRYSNRIKKLGLNSEIYKKLLDIESLFLGDDYYPFNNLFLFIMLRFIAYADVYSDKDSLYCQSILINVSKLKYHKFDSDSDKQLMIALIRKVDDYFMDYKDIFIEKNVTNPLSEYRINAEKERTEKSIQNLKEFMSEYELEYDENLSFNENATILRNAKAVRDKKEWLDMYTINYPENATLEELEQIINSIRPKENKPDDEPSDSILVDETSNDE